MRDSQVGRPRRVAVQGKSVVSVLAGQDLQSALNMAKCGDTIVLDAGSTYTGSFNLPNKGKCSGTAADYITIQTSNLDGLPSPGARLKPESHSKALARVVSTSGIPAFQTSPGAHHYKMIGLEITTNGAKYTADLVDMGAESREQRLLMKGFVIDRCFIHPAEISAANLFPATVERSAGRGIGADVADLWVINSYIAGFAGKFPKGSPEAGNNIDSYGVFSPVGPGPIHIINNYIEAQFNNIFTGGADPDTPNKARLTNATLNSATFSNVQNLSVGMLIALQTKTARPKPWQVARVNSVSGNSITYTLDRSCKECTAPEPPDNGGEARWNGDHIRDVEILGNTLNKPDAWNAFSNPKAWVELKECVNCIVDGNDMYSGVGTTLALTVRNQNGSAPWVRLENLVVSNNRIRGFKWAVGAQFKDNEQVTDVSGPARIINNLFISEKPIDGVPQFVLHSGGDSVTYQHNTVINSGAVLYGHGDPVSKLVFKDNISAAGPYGPVCFIRDGALVNCWPGYQLTNNVIVDNRRDPQPSLSNILSGTNFYPRNWNTVGFVDYPNGDYRLAKNSPYKGKASDGKDPGVDMDALLSALTASRSVDVGKD
jgi:hypothetical protein